MRSGLPRTEVILFEAGLPDGDVSYTLNGGAAGVVTPPPGATSVSINIAGILNTLSPGTLTGYRELLWSYVSGGIPISGEVRWTLEGSIPFGVTADGVRQKLGLDVDSDLPDKQIPLAKGYLKFQNTVGVSELIALETASEYNLLLIVDAIEAIAALELLPTLQVRVAKTETSGTNTYTRQNIDWEILDKRLRAYISDAISAVAPTNAASSGSLFLVTETAALFPDG